MSFKELQLVTKGYKWLQIVTNGYKWLKRQKIGKKTIEENGLLPSLLPGGKGGGVQTISDDEDYNLSGLP